MSDSDRRPPPSRDDVDRTLSELHRAAEEAEQVEGRARRVASRTSRRWGLLTLVLALIVAIVAAVVAVVISAKALSGQQATTAAVTQQRDTVNAALVKLGEANRLLEARGQAPVTAPATPTPTDAIAAAVLAKVLEQLPATPTADQVAARLQTAVTANVLGPTQDELSRLAAAYFAAHAPPGPTQAQIDAAVARAYRANPPKDGKDGAPGPAGPKGDPGKDGTAGRDGVSVTGQRFVRVDGMCVSRVTFSDGTGANSPAGDAACPSGDGNG